MALPARKTGMIDRDLALFPGWQLGSVPQRKRIERRDLLGAIARAERAPLGEPELDALTWLTQEWWDQGGSVDGRVRFTWYELGRDLYGRERAGWSPSGRHRQLMQDAIDNLHAVVITLTCVNVLTGESGPTLRSKVHILESVVDHDQLQLFRAGQADAASIGALRHDTVEIKLADWLVRQLLGGSLVLDWRTLRRLSGTAKRLWYYLGARSDEFCPGALPGEMALAIDLGPDLYASLNLRAARERDNRAALRDASQRISRTDPSYVKLAVVHKPGDEAYQLRVTRRRAGLVDTAVIEGTAVTT